MGFQVVDRSTFTIETDLPPSQRSIHPSGILHVTSYRAKDTVSVSSNSGGRDERHAFIWIANSLHVENAIHHIKTHGGFSDARHCVFVFIPFSSKENWLKRYPHATPAFETTYHRGKTKILLGFGSDENKIDDKGGSDDQVVAEAEDSEPKPNSNETAGEGSGSAALVRAAARLAANSCKSKPKIKNDSKGGVVIVTGKTVTKTTNVIVNKKEKKKRVYKSKAVNILKDNTYLPDAERDELHVEIYNYFKWLHEKLFEIEHKMEEDAAAKAMIDGETEAGNDDNDDEDSDEYDENNIHKSTGKRRYTPHISTSVNGVDVSELGGVVTKLESTFAIIPNMKLEETSEMTGTKKAVKVEGEYAPSDNDDNNNEGKAQNNNDAPFLEEALTSALQKLVAAREALGKPRRRSRRRPRPRKGDGLSGTGCKGGKRLKAEDFDILLERLARYKEEFGDCAVPRGYEDEKLANWVRGIREKRYKFQKEGKEYEVLHKGRPMTAKTLTPERLERLEAVGFIWTVAPAVPPPTWDDRFQELMEYYYANDQTWPTQSMGQLGEWVHRQRQMYSEKNVNYMRKYAHRLDEVGFEWTPRGYTKMSWDEGFELLMEFGRINGHLDVPMPDYTKVDKKSQEHRFYKWVESLHAMYRSYKVGRQSGSLTDERVVLLVKHGFNFRNY